MSRKRKYAEVSEFKTFKNPATNGTHRASATIPFKHITVHTTHRGRIGSHTHHSTISAPESDSSLSFPPKTDSPSGLNISTSTENVRDVAETTSQSSTRDEAPKKPKRVRTDQKAAVRILRQSQFMAKFVDMPGQGLQLVATSSRVFGRAPPHVRPSGSELRQMQELRHRYL